MFIFPAIDLYEKKAVRLYRGDYQQMTVYSDDPARIGEDFAAKGAGHIHIVDLEGAKLAATPNFDTVCEIKNASSLFCEIGGGIRDMKTIEKYLNAGIDRVIIGTAAITDEGFVKSAVKNFGGKIAVGADIKDGFVAIKGWLEKSSVNVYDFCGMMQDAGVSDIICTDISKDGAMNGTNRPLYKELSTKFSMNITASGGVSDLDDIAALKELGIYGAIIGKAYYTGAIDLAEAVRIAEG